jgi:hypothetical protein
MKSESRNEAQLESLKSPAWHEDVLRDREAKIKSGIHGLGNGQETVARQATRCHCASFTVGARRRARLEPIDRA